MKRSIAQVLSWTVRVVVAAAAAVLLLSFLLGERPLPYHFVDRTEELGLNFEYVSGREGRHWAIEQTGTGMGFIDHDNDGLLDVYFAQGHYLPGSPRRDEDVRNQLFHHFKDIGFHDETVATNTGDRGYGQGVAVGDYNNDGWDDIFVSNYGPNVLYRNDGDGTFTDVSLESGIRNSPYDADYANSCGWFDYNLDGYLDLYVCNYSSYRLDTHEDLYSDTGILVYRGPPTLKGQQDILYRNNGDGTFTDVTKEAGMDIRFDLLPDEGIFSPRGKAMSLAFPDINNDGWPDVFVGNDNDPQFLFINNQDGTFTEAARAYGLLRSADGLFCNLMGLDYGNINDDEYLDFIASNFQKRPQDLYISAGPGTYRAVSSTIELGSLTAESLTWGTGFVDFDNDGDLDLFIAAGHVMDNADTVQNEPVPQRNFVFENRFNDGFEGVFVDVTDQAGEPMEYVHWSRSALFGDIDNDGDIDVIVGNMPVDVTKPEPRTLSGRCDVLINEWAADVPPNNWITFSLKGTISHFLAQRHHQQPQRPGGQALSHRRPSQGHGGGQSHLQLPGLQRPPGPLRPGERGEGRCPGGPLAQRDRHHLPRHPGQPVPHPHRARHPAAGDGVASTANFAAEVTPLSTSAHAHRKRAEHPSGGVSGGGGVLVRLCSNLADDDPVAFHPRHLDGSSLGGKGGLGHNVDALAVEHGRPRGAKRRDRRSPPADEFLRNEFSLCPRRGDSRAVIQDQALERSASSHPTEGKNHSNDDHDEADDKHHHLQRCADASCHVAPPPTSLLRYRSGCSLVPSHWYDGFGTGFCQASTICERAAPFKPGLPH